MAFEGRHQDEVSDCEDKIEYGNVDGWSLEFITQINLPNHLIISIFK